MRYHLEYDHNRHTTIITIITKILLRFYFPSYLFMLVLCFHSFLHTFSFIHSVHLCTNVRSCIHPADVFYPFSRSVHLLSPPSIHLSFIYPIYISLPFIRFGLYLHIPICLSIVPSSLFPAIYLFPSTHLSASCIPTMKHNDDVS